MNNQAFTNKHIGHRIRYARIGSRIAISELSERTAIPIHQLEAFESDQDMITVIELVEIAAAMQLPTEYFLPNKEQDIPIDQWRLIDNYQKLTSTQRASLIRLVEDLQTGDALATETRPIQSPITRRWAISNLIRRNPK